MQMQKYFDDPTKLNVYAKGDIPELAKVSKKCWSGDLKEQFRGKSVQNFFASRPAISQLWRFKFRRTTLSNDIRFADLQILRLKNIKRDSRGWLRRIKIFAERGRGMMIFLGWHIIKWDALF